MENFDIVLALTRMALEEDDVRARHQALRLQERLLKQDKEQASKISRLLGSKSQRQKMASIALGEMRAAADAAKLHLPGEVLTPSTPLPHDRETSAPLVNVLFPDMIDPDPPILNASLGGAINDVLTEWQKAKELDRVGVAPHTRCLIYGPPGVGKTKLAHYLAKQLDLPCVEIRLDGLISSFLGTTARNIGLLFDFANRYRCVLFLDEFDAIAKARDDAQEVGEIKRVVNTLLQSLDRRTGLGVTLAATNHDHLLDSAIWRRFDARIHLDLPDEETRSQLLERFVKPLRLKEQERKLLVWATQNMSGADVESLVAAGKRFLVLHGGDVESRALFKNASARGQALLEALRQQAVLNARLFSPDRYEFLTSDQETLVDALLAATLTQREAGNLVGLSQSAVSRRYKARPVATTEG